MILLTNQCYISTAKVMDCFCTIGLYISFCSGIKKIQVERLGFFIYTTTTRFYAFKNQLCSFVIFLAKFCKIRRFP